MDKLTKAFSSDVKVNEGERAVSATITTTSVDREGDVVVAQGINYKAYQDNGVLMLNHDYWRLPIGKCVAMKKDNDCLTAKFVFAERPATHPVDEEWTPDTILSLMQQGVLSAFSIGFIPQESRQAITRDLNKYGEDCKRVISKSQLLEVSVVPIPCNPEAVATAVSKGLSASTAKSLFGYEAKSCLCHDCGTTIMEDTDTLCPKCKAADSEDDDDDDKSAKSKCPKCDADYEGDECPECAKAKSVDDEDDEDDEKSMSVVAEVELFSPVADVEQIVHREIDFSNAEAKSEAGQHVRQLVLVELAKAAGRAYLK